MSPKTIALRLLTTSFAVSAIVLFLFPLLSPVGSRVHSQEPKSGPSSEAFVEIQSDGSPIRTDRPYQLRVLIQNPTPNDIRLKYYPFLYLKKRPPEVTAMPEDGFYSEVHPDPDSEFMKTAALSAHKSLRFEVDLTKLKWGEIRSAFRPSDDIGKAVPRGEYVLYLELGVKSGDESGNPKTLVSNKLSAVIQ
jgi:hypothetical protein